ncbi:hypothetical protein PVAP13_1KG180777 [Panicum virgatum]|uniref:Uncharacterized protein n=1 Tax=Panicum virgatum TaxID=38727 RepID=A0A8T0X745_PANVG|nr:hypothetical protein PVAP13_1KG180777 [Panicum virgatum]
MHGSSAHHEASGRRLACGRRRRRRRPDVLEQAHHLLHGGPLLRRGRGAEEPHLQALRHLLLRLIRRRPRRLAPAAAPQQPVVHEVETLAVPDHAPRPARGRVAPPRLPRHELEHQGAEAVDIARWRLVAGAQEVGDPGLHVVAEEDVGRDQAPVHDRPAAGPRPPLVQEREPPGYPEHDAVPGGPVAGGLPVVLDGVHGVEADVLGVHAAHRQLVEPPVQVASLHVLEEEKFLLS